MSLKKYIKNIFKKRNINTLSKQLLLSYNTTRNQEQIKYLCHAPFKSMLFTNNGRVLSCCFNRQAILGEYPKQSLKEIWFGHNAEDLRSHIKKNNLDFGCFVCKNHLLNTEFNTVKARMFDHLPENTKGYPSMMEFDLDNTCNLECVMCNADNSSSIRQKSPLYAHYKTPYNEDFVKELEEFIPHLYQASFAGGEPFLIKLYETIWEKMLQLNPNICITVTTNGTVLNDKIKNLLDSGSFEISISLDSINKETYQTIRKNACFETVMANIDYFYNYCKSKNTFFGIWVCPLRINKFEIPDIINYFGEKDIEVFLHTVWVPPSVTLWNLPAHELRELYVYYQTAILKEQTQIQKNNKKRFNEFVLLLKLWLEKAEATLNKVSSIINEEDILEKIKSLHKSKGINEKDTNQKLNITKAKLTYCKQQLPETIYNNAIQILNTYPDDFIYQIFEAGTKEMINDFFKYLNK